MLAPFCIRQQGTIGRVWACEVNHVSLQLVAAHGPATVDYYLKLVACVVMVLDKRPGSS
jgi:hypothetical protein